MRTKITFECIIEKDENNPLTRSFTELEELTLQEFRADVGKKYDLEGLISFYLDPSGEEIHSHQTTLGENLRGPDQKLIVRNDKTEKVAGGGVGWGGVAKSGTSGQPASAKGGMATGGGFDADGAYGGRGIGGDAKGESGEGGAAQGGAAYNPGGIAEAGRGTGGQLRKTESSVKDGSQRS